MRIAVATSLLIGSGIAMASDYALREYQIKAERICSFARFVEWPTQKFASQESPFVIGVYGTDEISDLLREAIQGRRIKERPVVIKHIAAKEELPGCHILFVSRSEKERLSNVLKTVRREGILTVGETDNFLKRGGVISLVNLAGTVRFQINRDAARRERLTVSSKLLQLAIPSHVDPINFGSAGAIAPAINSMPPTGPLLISHRE